MEDSVFDDYGDSDAFSPVAVPVSRIFALLPESQSQSPMLYSQCRVEIYPNVKLPLARSTSVITEL